MGADSELSHHQVWRSKTSRLRRRRRRPHAVAPAAPAAERREVLEQAAALEAEDRLRVRLHALERTRAVAQALDVTVAARRRDLELGRKPGPRHVQGVVARQLDRTQDAVEDPASVVQDGPRLAMAELGLLQPAPEGPGDRLDPGRSRGWAARSAHEPRPRCTRPAPGSRDPVRSRPPPDVGRESTPRPPASPGPREPACRSMRGPAPGCR